MENNRTIAVRHEPNARRVLSRGDKKIGTAAAGVSRLRVRRAENQNVFVFEHQRRTPS